jgi:hypothetical protein
MKRAILSVVFVGLLCARAEAQVGETGRISTRSDVRMSIEGASGTAGARLDALAKTLGKPLGDIKACYADLVKEHPEVVGNLMVELSVPEKGKAKVQTPNASKELKKMDLCVDKAFAKVDFSEVPKPAGARITLELTNSAASSVGEVRSREQAASKVEVKTLPDGSFESEGKSIGGEVSYRVTAKGKGGAEAVEQVHQGVRDALPSLFDCRRKSSKNGSPEGDIIYTVVLKPAEKADVTLKSCTVAAERAPFCTDSALTQFMGKGRGRAEVTIHFAP